MRLRPDRGPTRDIHVLKLRRITRETLVGLLVFGLTFVIFLSSPVRQVADSQYSTLLSQSLLEHGSFRLDHYALSRQTTERPGYNSANAPYQLEVSRGHVYYHLPPGSSILSVPFVALLNLAGLSAADGVGAYDRRSEVLIQAIVAALLMALLASLFFYTARLLLPTGWGVVVALCGALGTQVYSTASRALWSHTWGILLSGVLVHLLLKREVKGCDLSPALLASLLSWMYFVRPTFAVQIFALSVYIFIFQRRSFARYAFTGALWMAGFLLYSWTHFGQLLPNYYRATRLQFGLFGVALAGNLISPARGLLIYVPVLFFVAYLLVRYRRRLPHRRLVWLSLFIIAGHLTVISGFTHWWGGHGFGARFTTDLVPWLVLTGILGLRGMLAWRNEHKASSQLAWRVQLALGGLLLLTSVFVNTQGAVSPETADWNKEPLDVDEHPERIWDWSRPQFLAGLLPSAPPKAFPSLPNARIDFASREAEKYLWRGWSAAEADARWSDSRHAAIIFSSPAEGASVLLIEMVPFLVPGALYEQRVNLWLNERRLPSLLLSDPAFRVYSIVLPREHLKAGNVLSFEIPEAASPQDMGVGDDRRELGIKVKWIRFEPHDIDTR